jgi:hypothetical protein
MWLHDQEDEDRDDHQPAESLILCFERPPILFLLVFSASLHPEHAQNLSPSSSLMFDRH